MSKIGKKIIKILSDISIDINNENNTVTVEGKYGKLSKTFLKIVTFEKRGDELSVILKESTKFGKSYHGLSRSLVQNMVSGVSNQITKYLIAEGVGYKFNVEKTCLNLNMGFTHSVQFQIPPNLSIKQILPTKIQISGIDKEQVGLYASQIRAVRPPEPYKGKGILYDKEVIRRKIGKTGK